MNKNDTLVLLVICMVVLYYLLGRVDKSFSRIKSLLKTIKQEIDDLKRNLGGN